MLFNFQEYNMEIKNSAIFANLARQNYFLFCISETRRTKTKKTKKKLDTF